MNLSVVIPVYNGQHTIPELVERLAQVLSGISDSYGTPLVCDGSPDDSWPVIEQLSARYEVIVTMDDDLQHPQEEIPVMLAKLAKGYDVVFGVPKKLAHSWWRNTTLPLRFASILGFLFTIIGIFVLIYVLVTYFVLGSIPGFSFLASAAIIFIGVQLFALGIIGEYLARIFDRSYGRPTYKVLKTTDQA